MPHLVVTIDPRRLRDDRKRGTGDANAGNVPDVQTAGARGAGGVLEVRGQDGEHPVPVDAGQAVHPG